MDTLVSMQVFRHIVEIGSFVGAAERMHISSTMASKHVAYLERRLATRLLHRTTRRVAPTDAGREYYTRLVSALVELDEASQSISQGKVVPRGRVRVVSPSAFGLRHLIAAAADYTARHAEVGVDIALADRNIDPGEEHYDVAIQVLASNQKPALPFARCIATARVALVAAPAYLAAHGTPDSLVDLSRHNLLHDGHGPHPLELLARDTTTRLAPSGQLTVNQPEALRLAALSGAGIALLGTDVTGDDIDAGRLVPVLGHALPPRELAIYVVHANSQRMPTASRSFIDFLAERFAGRTLCATLEPPVA